MWFSLHSWDEPKEDFGVYELKHNYSTIQMDSPVRIEYLSTSLVQHKLEPKVKLSQEREHTPDQMLKKATF